MREGFQFGNEGSRRALDRLFCVLRTCDIQTQHIPRVIPRERPPDARASTDRPASRGRRRLRRITYQLETRYVWKNLSGIRDSARCRNFRRGHRPPRLPTSESHRRPRRDQLGVAPAAPPGSARWVPRRRVCGRPSSAVKAGHRPPAFGGLKALTGLAVPPSLATKPSTVRCGTRDPYHTIHFHRDDLHRLPDIPLSAPARRYAAPWPV
jgi:hypothetical protein